MYRKNWKIFFCLAVLVACFTSSAQSAARKASQYSTDDKAPHVTDKAPDAADQAPATAERASDAVNKASEVVDKAVDAVNKAAGSVVEKATGESEGVSDVVNKASEVVDKAVDAVNKAAGSVVEKATGGSEGDSGVMSKASDAVVEKIYVDDASALSFQGMIHSREFILENQNTLFKDYDLDKLLHNIRIVLEKNNLQGVQKQFHQLFDKEHSSVYSCAAESATLDENLQVAQEEAVQTHNTQDNQKTIAEAGSHDYESHLQKTQERLEKIHEKSNRAELSQEKEDPLLSSKVLYKKGYDFILAANYAEAEKTFCAFQHRYKKDPLSDDVLFWLAESLLGQKRYHEAAQVYLTAWYIDKKKLYTSEVLLKLAMCMVALDQNKEVCKKAFAKKSKHDTLAFAFCKPLKKGGAVHRAH
ncbi:tetratricopeptide repeat protein [Bartonella rattaustraliani]|uniref:tetratricopeptide repeat protein n=1 Tax=Bartonella rattaustraliani TaxID=481139 RepID=UPI000316D392|nr:tetratricopeptide repeat protein [Bartonella rattaustraliani]